MTTERFDCIVIGAGAAGMIAAGRAASGTGSDSGADRKKVLVLEKNEKAGRKIAITGKGRCNVTNATYGAEFSENIVDGGKFLFSALKRFDAGDIQALLTEAGVPLKTERGNRVFPVSDTAFDVVDGLLRYAKRNGALFRFNTAVTAVLADTNGFKVKTTVGDYRTDNVIVATGGLSYSSTGSDGKGYEIAKGFGHSIVSCRPGLIPLETKEKWTGELMGLGLKNTGLTLMVDGKEIYNDFGELTFTHFGVNGPTVISASSFLQAFLRKEKKDWGREIVLHLDLKPAIAEQELDERLQKEFSAGALKPFRTILAELLPGKMIPTFIKLSGVPADKKGADLTREERKAVLRLLKDFTLHVSGTRPIEEAIITMGGVDTRELNPSTMESKLCSGLYFAGEVMDIDALTGGFNLQLAFSTGFAAGEAVRAK